MRVPAVPVEIREKLNGPHWRWWSLATGVALLVVTILVGTLLALALGQDILAFILLLLIAEILGVSAVGSGLLDSASRTMSRGGLARESTDVGRRRSARDVWTGHPEDLLRERRMARRRTEREDDDEEDEEELARKREKEEEDRRTIRSALVVLPVFVAFIVLLFQL